MALLVAIALAFLVGLGVREALDSRPAGAAAWILVMLFASVYFVRTGTDGVRPNVRVDRLAAWSGVLILVGLAGGILLPSPFGLFALVLITSPVILLWSQAFVRRDRP